MSPVLLYVVGAAGVGKSTLMRNLTASWSGVALPLPLPHTRYLLPDGRSGVELGRRRADFSGTDALSMSIAAVADEFVAGMPADVVLGEGQRLGTVRFLSGALVAGYAVGLVLLTASPALLDVRCSARPKLQNGPWRQASLTRALSLTRWAGETPGVRVLVLSSEREPLRLARSVTDWMLGLGEDGPAAGGSSPPRAPVGGPGSEA